MPKTKSSVVTAPAAAGPLGRKKKAKEQPAGTAKSKTVEPAKDAGADIDDIFGSSKHVKDVNSDVKGPSAGVKEAVSSESSKKTKKRKKDKGASSEGASNPPNPPAEAAGSASSAVQTIVDPSQAVLANPAKSAAAPSSKKRSAAEPDEEELMFRDSRGTGPRKATEEGFLVYKEAELGINIEAGGTDLCPFDCECCY